MNSATKTQKAKVDSAAEALLEMAKRFARGEASEDAVFTQARRFVRAEDSNE